MEDKKDYLFVFLYNYQYHEVTLPKKSLVKDLILKVGQELCFPSTTSFTIKTQQENIFTGTDQFLNDPLQNYFKSEKNQIFIMKTNIGIFDGKKFMKKDKILSNAGESGAGSKSTITSPNFFHTGIISEPTELKPEPAEPSMTEPAQQPVEEVNYCGLSNQGATCYLNSLLQTLYMTPEFRAALYNWSFEEFAQREFQKKLLAQTESENTELKNTGSNEEKNTILKNPDLKNSELKNIDRKNESLEEVFEKYKIKLEENCIPRQLQKLFIKLNSCDKRLLSTKHLTKSFGWKEADAFTQHDVQELCRVLFDTVEKVWEGTEQASLINQLYQGELKDFVQCLNCGHESSRTDKFLDIPLVIKGFGESEAVTSVQEALKKFIEPEMLIEENQYLCEKCSKKCDAKKGLKFTRLPYLLCLQLKRFDFDFTNLCRIKLNDRVSFTEILDMNPFIINNDSDSKLMDEKMNGQNHKNGNGNTEEMAFKNGPYVYELYSVLIHRGSALGGHYYAFIKSFYQNKWFEFNDSSVNEIPSNSFSTTFGGNTNSTSSYYYSSQQPQKSHYGTNAYMLMYRLKDNSRNISEFTKNSLPEKIKKSIELEEKKELESKMEKERLKSMYTVVLIYKDSPTTEIKIHKDDPLEKIREMAAKTFNLENYYPNNIRLRKFSAQLPNEPIPEDELAKPCSNFFYYSCFQSKPSLYVEVKQENEEFPKYGKNDITIRCSGYNTDTANWTTFSYFTFQRDVTLLAVKEKLSSFYNYNIPSNEIVLVEDMGLSTKILENNNKKFYFEYSSSSSKFYAEPRSTEESTPRSIQHIDKLKYTVQIKFSEPDEKELKHVLNVDKRLTVSEIKKKIGSVISLGTDEFLVLRHIPDTQKYELIKNETLSLQYCGITNNTSFLIERGRPIKKGEILCKFFLYDIVNEVKTELFQMILLENLSLLEVKEELIKFVHNKSNHNSGKTVNNIANSHLMDFPHNPERIRIRNINSLERPITVYPSSKNLKDIIDRYTYLSHTVPSINIQILPENQKEEKISDDDIIIITRQFFPDKYELSLPTEIRVSKYDKLADLKSRISEIMGIQAELTVAKAEHYELHQILKIPDLNWYPPPPDPDYPKYKSNSFYQLESYRTLNYLDIEDGSIILYRNLSIPLKKLTGEEEKKILNSEEQKNSKQGKSRTSSYRKEDGISINITDVPIFDNLKTDK